MAVFGWIALVACFGLALLTLVFSTRGPIELGAANEMGTAPAAL